MASEPGRYSQVGRTLTVVAQLLRGKKQDRRSVAAAVQVQLAGADRILKAIGAFLPVRTERVDRKRIYSLPPPAPPKRFQSPIAAAACFGASLATLFEGSTYAAGMQEALAYVLQNVRARTRFEDLDRKFFFVRRGGESALPQRAGDLDVVIDAIFEQTELSITYARFGNEEQHLRIQPLSIAIYDHQLYVVARERGQAPRLLRFSRITSVEDEEHRFHYPPPDEYQPSDLFRDSFGVFVSDDYPVEDVAVLLLPKWRGYAHCHRWHSTQRVTDRDDGVVVEFKVRTCPELQAWILGFGADATVLKPESLAAEIAERRRQAAAGIQKRRPTPLKKAKKRTAPAKAS